MPKDPSTLFALITLNYRRGVAMKTVVQISLSLSLLLGVTACSKSPLSDSNRNKKSQDSVTIPADFDLLYGVSDISGDAYVPRVSWVLKTPIKIATLPPDKNVALIFSGALPGANAEITDLVGQVEGGSSYGTFYASENKIEKLNANTWRIVLSRSSMNQLVKESGMDKRYYTLNYAIPTAKVASVFKPILGLRPISNSQKNLTIVGQIIIPIDKMVRPTWPEDQVGNEHLVKEKLQDYSDGLIKGRSVHGEVRNKINGQSIIISASLVIRKDATCTMNISTGQILEEQGPNRTTRPDLKKQAEGNCQVVGNHLVIENIGRLSLKSHVSLNGVQEYTLALRKELFIGETLGVLQFNSQLSDISLTVRAASSY